MFFKRILSALHHFLKILPYALGRTAGSHGTSIVKCSIIEAPWTINNVHLYYFIFDGTLRGFENIEHQVPLEIDWDGNDFFMKENPRY